MSATVKEGGTTGYHHPNNLVSMHNFNCLLQAANVLLKEVQDDMPITPIPPPEDIEPPPPPLTTESSTLKQQQKSKKPSPSSSSNGCSQVGEKLTLDQIKHLPEKKLISLFADYICDEMKRKYSYRCLILPSQCAQLFESFASEMRAKKCMLDHLKKHIRDLEHRHRQSNGGTQHFFYTCRSKQQELKKKVKLEPSLVPKKSEPLEEGVVFSKSRCVSRSCSLKKKKFTTLMSREKLSKQRGAELVTPPKLLSPVRGEPECNGHVESPSLPPVDEDVTLVTLTPMVPPPSMVELTAWLHDHDYSKPANLPLDPVRSPASQNGDDEQSHSHQSASTSLWEQQESSSHPTIPAPFFPQVYQPELEAATICEVSSQENSVNSAEDLDQERKCDDTLEPFKPKKRGRRRKLFFFDDVGLYAENGENIPTGLEHIKMTPSEESKFAMKCINALRSKKKDERSPVKCKICPNKTYTATATLLSHYRSHHAGIKPYKCGQCSASFTRQHSLKYHTMIHEERSRFTCPTCCKEFRHPSHFKEHLRRHTGETPFHCTDCQRKFKTRNTFKRHMLRSHYKKLTYKNSIESISQEEVDRILKPKKCKT